MDSPLGQSEPINFTIKWNINQPDNIDGIENCLSIHKLPEKTGMVDLECGSERNHKATFNTANFCFQ